MKRRLFISLKVPEEVKKIIRGDLNAVKLNANLRVRYVPEKNWHITLVFLGWLGDQDIESVRRALDKFKAAYGRKITVDFDGLEFGPRGTSKRMIWATTSERTTRTLAEVNALLKKCLREENVRWEESDREYSGHLTLARFLPESGRHLPPMEGSRPSSFETAKIFLTESHLKESGPIYEDLEEIYLLG